MPVKTTRRVFTCTDHAGHWPVGVASVIVANDAAEAKSLLDAELVRHGLDPHEPYTLAEMDMSKSSAPILCDGDY